MKKPESYWKALNEKKDFNYIIIKQKQKAIFAIVTKTMINT